MAAITFRPDANSVIVRLIIWKLKEEGLSKMPKSVGCLDCRVSSLRVFLAAKCPNTACQVGFGNTISEIGWNRVKPVSILIQNQGAVGRHIIRKADLIRLVNVQHATI